MINDDDEMIKNVKSNSRLFTYFFNLEIRVLKKIRKFKKKFEKKAFIKN